MKEKTIERRREEESEQDSFAEELEGLIFEARAPILEESVQYRLASALEDHSIDFEEVYRPSTGITQISWQDDIGDIFFEFCDRGEVQEAIIRTDDGEFSALRMTSSGAATYLMLFSVDSDPVFRRVEAEYDICMIHPTPLRRLGRRKFTKDTGTPREGEYRR
ncbi:hypothetical protein KY362_06770 [Candidatus Woesearchaeota archaeon]|nr:hypothetical protein [Candidatus Woesearchaeota archaeon]